MMTEQIENPGVAILPMDFQSCRLPWGQFHFGLPPRAGGQRHQKTDPQGTRLAGLTVKSAWWAPTPPRPFFRSTALLRSGSLGAAHRLANFETFELRVIQIQRLVVPCPTMRCAERL
jgi:hypothetical protein